MFRDDGFLNKYVIDDLQHDTIGSVGSSVDGFMSEDLEYAMFFLNKCQI